MSEQPRAAGKAAKRTPVQPRTPPPPVTAASLERAALAYLQRFASSSGHLRRLLLHKVQRSAQAHGTDLEQATGWIDTLIDKLLRNRLLDDALYAEAKVRSLQRRGLPRVAIARTLAAKQVSKADSATALAALVAEDGDGRLTDLRAAIAYAKRRRLGPFRKPEDRAGRRERDWAALARRGFSRDIAGRVMTADSPDALARLLATEE